MSNMDKGYLMLYGEDGVQEYDSYHCVHCQRAIIIKPGSGQKRGFCLMCYGAHCGRQECHRCIPFEKKLAIEEARAVRKRQDAW